MNDAHKILDYWYNQEFFSPFWPPKSKEQKYFVSRGYGELPWLKINSENMYDIFLGKVNSRDLVNLTINNKEIDESEEGFPSCICAFKLNSKGFYVENSFSISNFVWAIAKIKQDEDVNVCILKDEIDDFNSKFNDNLKAVNGKFLRRDFERIHREVLNKIELVTRKDTFFVVVNTLKVKDIKQDEGSSILSGCYISDINRIKDDLENSKRIERYIGALINPTHLSIEIDKSIRDMKKWTSPDRYPLGKWPLKYNVNLMQQIAINIAISNEYSNLGIFSINNPQGTGKITILKEIISSFIVERALLLLKYEDPDDAFINIQFQDPISDDLAYFFKPDRELIKYGIIAASNSDKLIENAFKELTLSRKVKNTYIECFEVGLKEDIYFSNFIKNILKEKEDENSWGLMCYDLFKKENMDDLKNELPKLFHEKTPSWEEAKVSFINKYEQLKKLRDIIQGHYEDENVHFKNICLLNKVKHELIRFKIEHEKQTKLYEEKIKEKEELENDKNLIMEKMNMFKKKPSFFKRLLPFLFKNDSATSELHELVKNLDLNEIEIINLQVFIDSHEAQVKKLEDTLDYINNNIEEIENDIKELKEKIDKYKILYGKGFAFEEFWDDIEQNETSQNVSPWTTKEYDNLREEMFLEALILHKAFILNSKSIEQNSKCLINFWNDKISEKDRYLSFSHLLNTLLLIVPVIFTTFDSIASYLKYADKDELGTLVIDEAAQIQPQHALGALWRTQRAIVMGDPLQVEPQVKIPKELSKRFQKEFEIKDGYKDENLSVQVLADNINKFGCYRTVMNEKTWLGCPLVVRERCLDPMFLISNSIAYNNKLFNRSVKPKDERDLLFNSSLWIDIENEGESADYFIKKQGDKVIEILKKAFLKYKSPDLFIISPFKSVIDELKFILKKSFDREWVDNFCGTVQEFYDRQASEVILLLECDKEDHRKDIQWICEKPNILNAAVSRTKYRIVIIGDSKLWRAVPDFDYAYKLLMENK